MSGTNVDLSGLLSKPASEVVPPKPLPAGIYICQVGDHEAKVAGQKNNTVVEFEMTALQPTDNDPSDCELPKRLRQSFWLTPDAMHRFKNFLENTLQIEGGQRTLLEMLPEAKGRMCRANVTQKAYTPKGETESVIINEIDKLFPLEG